jgi:uncharacterized protein
VSQDKRQQVREEIRAAGKVIIAFSGGVDSTLLAQVAMQELGRDCQAITVDNGFMSRFELERAVELARSLGLNHSLLPVEMGQQPEIRNNQPRRCYFCKKAIFSRLMDLAQSQGSQVMEGSHLDDSLGYRPGQQALKELGISSPLKKYEFNKEEIRQWARELGLPNWQAPASPCLATRFSYGKSLSPEHLRRVERAEDILRQAGFKQFRVRSHEDLARIEVDPEERPRFFDSIFMDQIDLAFKELGYLYVSLDLKGYRMGSLDEKIKGE